MQLQQEREQIERLRDEMDQEKSLQAEKRRQEREYLQKMLVENDKHKLRMMEIDKKERADDVAAQEAYAKMLEKQE